MSSVEKRHGNGRRGSGPRLSDAFSDSSGSGSFLDDTDREVSSLTERAFRSLCIGDEAVYSDAHLGSSPHERQRAFTQEAAAHSDAATTAPNKQAANETLPLTAGGCGPELSGTFQGWLAETTLTQQQQQHQQQLSYLSNGSTEVAWQQKRSTSRVSSLIKAFGGGGVGVVGGDGLYDPMIADAMVSEAWDRSALMSLHHELADFSVYQQGFRNMADAEEVSGSFLRTGKLKASGRFHALSSTNMFLHSESSPFRAWSDYKRLMYHQNAMATAVAVGENFPRWYDSPLYKELTSAAPPPPQRSQGQRSQRLAAEDWAQHTHAHTHTQGGGITTQKAWAVEKRCESEMTANGAPWKRSGGGGGGRSKLPGLRPSTVSPSAEQQRRPNSAFVTTATRGAEPPLCPSVMADDLLPSNTATPFSISQLLTPVLPAARQGTDTSEVLRGGTTLSPPATELDAMEAVEMQQQQRSLVEVRQVRADSYKARASSLLFNLKDNRKRVKSTYSPTRFRGAEVTDRSRQPSQMDAPHSDHAPHSEHAQLPPAEDSTANSAMLIPQIPSTELAAPSELPAPSPPQDPAGEVPAPLKPSPPAAEATIAPLPPGPLLRPSTEELPPTTIAPEGGSDPILAPPVAPARHKDLADTNGRTQVMGTAHKDATRSLSANPDSTVGRYGWSQQPPGWHQAAGASGVGGEGRGGVQAPQGRGEIAALIEKDRERRGALKQDERDRSVRMQEDRSSYNSRSLSRQEQSKEYSSAQSNKGQEYSSAQSIKGQEYSSAQSIKGKEYSPAQSNKTQEYSSAQSKKNQEYNSAQSKKNQEYSSQSNKNQEYSSAQSNTRNQEYSSSQNIARSQEYNPGLQASSTQPLYTANDRLNTSKHITANDKLNVNSQPKDSSSQPPVGRQPTNNGQPTKKSLDYTTTAPAPPHQPKAPNQPSKQLEDQLPTNYRDVQTPTKTAQDFSTAQQQQPVTSNQSIKQPTANQSQSLADKQPTANQQLPVSNQSSLSKQPAVAKQPAVTKQTTVNNQQPISKQETVTNQQPDKPVVAKKPVVSNAQPINQPSFINSQSTVSSQQGIYSQPPISSQQGLKGQPPINSQQGVKSHLTTANNQEAAVTKPQAAISDQHNSKQTLVSSPQPINAKVDSVDKHPEPAAKQPPISSTQTPLLNPPLTSNQKQPYAPYTTNQKQVNAPHTANQTQQVNPVVPASQNLPNHPFTINQRQAGYPLIANQNQQLNPPFSTPQYQHLNPTLTTNQKQINPTQTASQKQTNLTLTANQSQQPNLTPPAPTTSQNPQPPQELMAGDADEAGRGLSQPIKEERFSISDILSIRDKELMRRERLKELRLALSDLTQPSNQRGSEHTPDRKSDTHAVKDAGAAVSSQGTEASPIGGRERSVANGGLPQKYTEMPRNPEMKEWYDQGVNARRESADREKTAGKIISLKERAQTKQELLTSKVKAHAQKEISALKEKGFMSRNAPKPPPAVAREKGPEQPPPVKKEITADKLNHLFKDLTRYGEPKQLEPEVEDTWQDGSNTEVLEPSASAALTSDPRPAQPPPVAMATVTNATVDMAVNNPGQPNVVKDTHSPKERDAARPHPVLGSKAPGAGGLGGEVKPAVPLQAKLSAGESLLPAQTPVGAARVQQPVGAAHVPVQLGSNPVKDTHSLKERDVAVPHPTSKSAVSLQAKPVGAAQTAVLSRETQEKQETGSNAEQSRGVEKADMSGQHLAQSELRAKHNTPAFAPEAELSPAQRDTKGHEGKDPGTNEKEPTQEGLSPASGRKEISNTRANAAKESTESGIKGGDREPAKEQGPLNKRMPSEPKQGEAGKPADTTRNANEAGQNNNDKHNVKDTAASKKNQASKYMDAGNNGKENETANQSKPGVTKSLPIPVQPKAETVEASPLTLQQQCAEEERPQKGTDQMSNQSKWNESNDQSTPADHVPLKAHLSEKPEKTATDSVKVEGTADAIKADTEETSEKASEGGSDGDGSSDSGAFFLEIQSVIGYVKPPSVWVEEIRDGQHSRQVPSEISTSQEEKRQEEPKLEQQKEQQKEPQKELQKEQHKDLKKEEHKDPHKEPKLEQQKQEHKDPHKEPKLELQKEQHKDPDKEPKLEQQKEQHKDPQKEQNKEQQEEHNQKQQTVPQKEQNKEQLIEHKEEQQIEQEEEQRKEQEKEQLIEHKQEPKQVQQKQPKAEHQQEQQKERKQVEENVLVPEVREKIIGEGEKTEGSRAGPQIIKEGETPKKENLGKHSEEGSESVGLRMREAEAAMWSAETHTMEQRRSHTPHSLSAFGNTTERSREKTHTSDSASDLKPSEISTKRDTSESKPITDASQSKHAADVQTYRSLSTTTEATAPIPTALTSKNLGDAPNPKFTTDVQTVTQKTRGKADPNPTADVKDVTQEKRRDSGGSVNFKHPAKLRDETQTRGEAPESQTTTQETQRTKQDAHGFKKNIAAQKVEPQSISADSPAGSEPTAKLRITAGQQTGSKPAQDPAVEQAARTSTRERAGDTTESRAGVKSPPDHRNTNADPQRRPTERLEVTKPSRPAGGDMNPPVRPLGKDAERREETKPDKPLGRDAERRVETKPDHPLDRDAARREETKPDKPLGKDPERREQTKPDKPLGRDAERRVETKPDHPLDRDAARREETKPD
ncbi:titin homolog, partial [Sardina pilchardus]|uniref:titin homolog n=1 Tax=Sardina pilchardus TaxID=27697 RepID=UPI002E146454